MGEFIPESKRAGDTGVTASIEKDGMHYEILVDSEKAFKYKKGEIKDINEVLKVDGIFKDVRTGERASSLKENFGTTDPNEIADVIIKKGKIQLTTDYRNKLVEEKKNEIISRIISEGIDPRTNTQIPRARIENAFEKAKIKIDPFKNINEQLPLIVEALKEFTPISFEKKKLKLTAPPNQVAKIYSPVNKYGSVIREDYLNDGSLVMEVEIPAGNYDEFINEINKTTHGDIKIEKVN